MKHPIEGDLDDTEFIDDYKGGIFTVRTLPGLPKSIGQPLPITNAKASSPTPKQHGNVPTISVSSPFVNRLT
jgi:hypothetical protein